MLKILSIITPKRATIQKACKWLMMEPKKREKAKRKYLKAQAKRKKDKNDMIKAFGKARYYLALWFGQWILFAWNRKPPG